MKRNIFLAMLIFANSVSGMCIPTKEDTTKVKLNSESEEQTPMPIIFEGCGTDGGGQVFDNSVKCPWCCLYSPSAGIQKSLCYSKECDQNEGTSFNEPVCGDCIKIDDNPNFDPLDPNSPPYRLYVYSSSQTFYVFTYSTVEESDISNKLYYRIANFGVVYCYPKILF